MQAECRLMVGRAPPCHTRLSYISSHTSVVLTYKCTCILLASDRLDHARIVSGHGLIGHFRSYEDEVSFSIGDIRRLIAHRES